MSKANSKSFRSKSELRARRQHYNEVHLGVRKPAQWKANIAGVRFDRLGAQQRGRP